MSWNPFKGGSYDLSQLSKYARYTPGGVAYTMVSDPTWYDRAANNIADRAASGQGVSALLPQTIYHKAEAADGSMPQNQDSSTDDRSSMPEGWNDPAPKNSSNTSNDPNTSYINGVAYNLNDPGQFQAYVSAAESILNSDFETYRGRAERLRDEDIEIAKAQEDEVIYNIDRALLRLTEQEGQYNTDWARSVSDLSEGFRQGSARRQAFYAAAAPRVYQSSQGTSQNYAENKYKEGQTRYEEDKSRAVKGFADTRQDYGQSRMSTEKQFNLFKTQRTAQAQDEIAEQARRTREKLDSIRGGFKNYSDEMRNTGGSNSSRWGGVQFAEKDLNYSPSNVNLNDLMQFIKFQPAGAAGSSTSVARQSIATPESGGQSLGNYLGYQPETSEESTINAYKKGYAY